MSRVVVRSACRPPGAGLGSAHLMILLGAPFIATANTFATVIAAPSIQGQLHMSDAGVQLVVAGYVAVYAAGLVAGGRLGDIYGRRKLLTIGLGVFAAASLLAAAAPDQTLLILGRGLQGAGAAVMYPQALALIRAHSAGGPALAQAMGLWGAALGLASASAQLLGALLIQVDVADLGWRAIYLVNVPIASVLAGATRLLPAESRTGAERLDFGGLILLTSGLLSFVLALTTGRELGWPAWAWASLAGAGVLGGLLVAHERRHVRRGMTPLIAVELLHAPRLTWWLGATLLLYAAQLSLWVQLGLYLQQGIGLRPVEAGLVTAPSAIIGLLVSLAFPRMASRRPRAAIAVGALTLAASTAGVAALAMQAGRHPAALGLAALLAVAGIGFGLVLPALTAAVLQEVPDGHEGAGAGILITAQQTAGAVGVGMTGVLFFGLLHERFSYGVAFGSALGLQAVLFGAAAAVVGALRGAR